jgi:hypothetical protein
LSIHGLLIANLQNCLATLHFGSWIRIKAEKRVFSVKEKRKARFSALVSAHPRPVSITLQWLEAGLWIVFDNVLNLPVSFISGK